MRMIDRYLSRLADPAHVFLRALAGFMFFFHGAQKMLGWFSTHAGPAPLSQMWIGGVIELVCGALIMVGLFTRPAAFLASGQMAVAFFQMHVGDDWSRWHWLPIVNRGELAALYCAAFLLLCAIGPGPLSVDRALKISR